MATLIAVLTMVFLVGLFTHAVRCSKQPLSPAASLEIREAHERMLRAIAAGRDF